MTLARSVVVCPHRHRVFEAVGTKTVSAEELEERPQRGGHQLQRPRLVAARRRADERDNFASLKIAGVDPAVRETLFQEGPDESRVV